MRRPLGADCRAASVSRCSLPGRRPPESRARYHCSALSGAADTEGSKSLNDVMEGRGSRGRLADQEMAASFVKTDLGFLVDHSATFLPPSCQPCDIAPCAATDLAGAPEGLLNLNPPEPGALRFPQLLGRSVSTLYIPALRSSACATACPSSTPLRNPDHARAPDVPGRSGLTPLRPESGGRDVRWLIPP
jgi:hypothetical protein